MVRLSRLGAQFFLILAMAVSGFGTTYYIAASGSDSNNGTSKTTPWLHAPGMTGCTGTCASTTPQPGDRFIFRGGDMWHHAASGQTPVGLHWAWNWAGTSSQRIYIGVDQTWFSGASWHRPILTGDNTPGIGSCNGANDFVSINNNYVDFDDFEFTGGCWSGASDTTIYFTMNSPTHDNSLKNSYFHGWRHTAFSCSVGAGGLPQGQCDVGIAIRVSSQASEDVNNEYAYNVVDGQDSDPLSGGGITFGGYNVHHNIFRYASQGMVTNNSRYVHDNLFEYIQEPGDGVGHGNTFELNGSNYDFYFYNNVVRHNGTTATLGVNLWWIPSGNAYVFNNVMYDNHQGGTNYIAFGCKGTALFYNNTIELTSGQMNKDSCSIQSTNNHFINATSLSGVWKTTSGVTDTTVLYQSAAQASAQGYTSSDAYAPSSANGGTIGTGTTLTSSCNTIPDSQARASCLQDTTLGVSYDTVNHAVVVPSKDPIARTAPWDVGAFQSGSSASNPTPPTALTAAVQ